MLKNSCSLLLRRRTACFCLASVFLCDACPRKWRWLLQMQLPDVTSLQTLLFILQCFMFCFHHRFLFKQLKTPTTIDYTEMNVFPPEFKWSHSIIYVTNRFWKPMCVFHTILLWSLPCNRASVTLQFINMTNGGHYLRNESLAAPSGVVKALDKECQKLPSDQLPPSDDHGSSSIDARTFPTIWHGQ